MSEQQLPSLNISYIYPISERPLDCLSVKSHREFTVTLLLVLDSITVAIYYQPANIYFLKVKNRNI